VKLLIIWLLGVAAYNGTPLGITAEFESAFPNISVPADMISITSEFPSGSYVPDMAFCKYNKNKPNKIYINADWWSADVNIWYKRKVIFHELGHCVLNLRHNNSYHSIMNIKLDTVDTDGSNWDELVEELQDRYVQTVIEVHN